jgi:hypothetical protein
LETQTTTETTEWHGVDRISRAIVSRDSRDAIIYIDHSGGGSWYWLQRRPAGTTASGRYATPLDRLKPADHVSVQRPLRA